MLRELECLEVGSFAWGLSQLVPQLGAQKQAEQDALQHPGKLFKARRGNWMGAIDGNIFTVIQYLRVDEIADVDGVGLWLVDGYLPDETKYSYRFKTLKECRGILSGMQIEFTQGL